MIKEVNNIGNKIGIRGLYPNIIKALYDKPIANILNSKKLRALPLRSVTNQLDAYSCHFY